MYFPRFVPALVLDGKETHPERLFTVSSGSVKGPGFVTLWYPCNSHNPRQVLASVLTGGCFWLVGI